MSCLDYRWKFSTILHREEIGLRPPALNLIQCDLVIELPQRNQLKGGLVNEIANSSPILVPVSTFFACFTKYTNIQLSKYPC